MNGIMPRRLMVALKELGLTKINSFNLMYRGVALYLEIQQAELLGSVA